VPTANFASILEILRTDLEARRAFAMRPLCDWCDAIILPRAGELIERVQQEDSNDPSTRISACVAAAWWRRVGERLRRLIIPREGFLDVAFSLRQ
jgi:hypothetical protein